MRKNKRIKQTNQTCAIPVLTEWDLKFMAYHEAAHAVCSYFLPEREQLILITIDPASDAFGMVKTELRPHHNETETSLKSTIATLLAGKLAEEMFLNSKTTSCIYDLNNARKIATDMVLKFGMGEKSHNSALNINECYVISQTHKEQICQDIIKILEEAEKKATTILQKNSLLVELLAEKLLQQKTLIRNEIIDFFTENTK